MWRTKRNKRNKQLTYDSRDTKTFWNLSYDHVSISTIYIEILDLDYLDDI